MVETNGDEMALSPVQETVLAAILAGRSFTRAAAEGGVNVKTVWWWRTRDATFIARYNQALTEQREEIQASLRVLTRRSLRVLAEASKSDQAIEVRLKAAAIVLKGLRHNVPPKPGPTEPGSVEQDLSGQRYIDSLRNVTGPDSPGWDVAGISLR